MTGTPCARPGCAGRGTIDETGFCDRCGRPPARTPSGRQSRTSPPSRTSVVQTAPFRPAVSVLSVAPGGSTELPPLPEREPDSLVRHGREAFVAEHERRCRGCERLVGQGRAGRPGRTTGFCGVCMTPFCFEPRLAARDRIGRYEIVGPLAYGGVGWVYLAKDTDLDGKRVVLKGLIDPANPHARRSAAAEKRYLTILDHPNIVRITDVVNHPDPAPHDPPDYIVMDFVGGSTLYDVAGAARRGELSLPVENVIGYGIAILGALDYLHGKRYVYCDLKPDNVIHGAKVRLIDLGAVRSVDDRTSATWGARKFRVSDEEIRSHGLGVRSDLYSVGTTLRAVFAGTQDDRAGGESAIGTGIASFRAVLERAIAPWPERFETASDMAEQLLGVFREIRALRGEPLPPVPSALFASATPRLDTGLGRPPELGRWTGTAADPVVAAAGAPLADGRPLPEEVAVGLPDPLIDRADPMARQLASVSATDPNRLLAELAVLPETVETALWRARAHLRLADHTGMRDDLADARRAGPGPNWRITWHDALLALARADAETAGTLFDAVRRAVPGEIAPKLALAYCAEHAGEHATASGYYDAVWCTDHTCVSAAFGLARIRLAAGDRTAAVSIVDEVPALSRHYDAARVAAVQLRVGTFDTTPPPTAADLFDAAARLRRLALDRSAMHRLTTLVRQAALPAVGADWPPPADEQAGDVHAVLGDTFTPDGLRRLLAASFHDLTRQATDGNQHGTLMDLANAVRPRTWT